MLIKTDDLFWHFFLTKLDIIRAIVFFDNKGLRLIVWSDCLPFVR